ncbi:sulfatase-like hydrolase/transferase [Candidatus Fermentibacteria bacterium]|nr:sulfatase-like hydrolase/transferase [Candidatus Fermentibacteria bacterium]
MRRGFVRRSGLFAVAFWMLAVSCGGQARPNVLLVVIDALRSDHLGCYGYHRDTSPVIDSLASSGTLWLRAQAQAPWTLPSMASIMTGQTVKSHGTRKTVGALTALSPELPTLSTLLSQHGYRTAAFMNCHWCSQLYGFHRGFGMFDCVDAGHGRAETTVDMVLDWLSGLEQGERFAVVVHLFDVHAPYRPPGEYRSLFLRADSVARFFWDVDKEAHELYDPQNVDTYIDLYDGEIAWVDRNLHRLLQGLGEMGRADSTIIVITADHGEEFLEHGWIEHGVTLYQEVLHVPLIISGPGVPRGVVDSAVVGSIDVMPTVLSLLDVEIPSNLDGVALRPGRSPRGRTIPSGGATPDCWCEEGLVNRKTVSVLRGDSKLIYDGRTDSSVTYDLSEDPLEQSELPPDSSLLEAALYYYSSPPKVLPPILEGLGEEHERIIRSLGYF